MILLALRGVIRFLNKIGDMTIKSSKKVGHTAEKPVKKISTLKPTPKLRKFRGSTVLTRRKSPFGFFRRPKMSESEIEILKRLVETEAYKEKLSEKPEEKERYETESLSKLLEEREKELDPKFVYLTGIITGSILALVIILLGFGFVFALLSLLVMFMVSVFARFLPKLREGSRADEISRELPYALRQMATELRAGLGFHDAMKSVATSGYGALSEEFARTLEEIKYGESTTRALMNLSVRVPSPGLKRAIQQIVRSLESGGDVAKALEIIAEDIAYELRMKFRDYSQKLNSFMMIYMFIGIVGPAVLPILLIIATIFMPTMVIPSPLILILYLLLLPLVVVYFIFIVKRLEPRV